MHTKTSRKELASVGTALSRAVQIAGSKKRLAEALDVTPQRLHNWIARGSVPPRFALALEAYTLGKVRACELNPRTFGACR